jgi:hypothetical protein
MKHNFRSVKDATFDAIPPAAPERVGLVAAGNPDVLREAKRKRGGRVKLSTISGVRPKHRLDRPSLRKFADGGTADAESDQSAQTTTSSDDATSSTGRGFVDSLLAIPKVQGVRTGWKAIQKVTPVVMRALQEPTGPKPAYRRGGRARR